MTQENFGDWDATSSNNTTVTGDAAALNIDEGMTPGLVNDAMRAIMSGAVVSWGGMHSGSARPAAVQTNRFWLDTTTAATPIINWYDGTDNIVFATMNATTNVITIDSNVVFPSAGIANVVEDTTPQLGGNLDLNAFGITLPGATVTDITGADTLLVSGTAGTSGNLASWNVDGDLVDAGAAASGITRGTSKATTSGTSVDHTGIAAGVNRIVVSLAGVSTDGTDDLQLQLGDAGGFETTAYDSSAADGTGSVDSTIGFVLTRGNGATRIQSGVIILIREAGNLWVSQGGQHPGPSLAGMDANAGQKTLSGEITQLRLTTTGGTDAFDAGAYNIFTEV